MTRSAPSFFTALLLLAAAVAAAGCNTQNALIAEQDAELDSVNATNRDLHVQLRALRDSLQFYDDIDSGQYYRDRRLLTQEIEQLQYDLAVCGDGGQTVETLLVDDLFGPASAELTDAGREQLVAVARTLRDEHAESRVRVEGHADDVPIGPGLADRFPSNWELAAHRAAAVVRFLVDEGLPAEQVEMLSFGSARPLARNDTAEGRRQNRRIRVAVMPR